MSKGVYWEMKRLPEQWIFNVLSLECNSCNLMFPQSSNCVILAFDKLFTVPYNVFSCNIIDIKHF